MGLPDRGQGIGKSPDRKEGSPPTHGVSFSDLVSSVSTLQKFSDGYPFQRGSVHAEAQPISRINSELLIHMVEDDARFLALSQLSGRQALVTVARELRSRTDLDKKTLQEIIQRLSLVVRDKEELLYLQEREKELLKRRTERLGGRLYTEEQLGVLSDVTEGTGIIRTVLPPGLPLKFKSRKYDSNGGDQTFGDGSDGHNDKMPGHFSNSNKVTTIDGQVVYPTDMVEAVAFLPAMEDIIEEVDIKRVGFMGRERVTGSTRKKRGEKPLLVTNAITGVREVGVYFDYVFNPHLVSQTVRGALGIQHYRGQHRTGNLLIIRTILPKSVIDQLQVDIEDNPDRARQVVERLVRDRGNITEDHWLNGSITYSQHFKSGHTRPPYESIHAAHRLYMVTPSEFPPYDDGSQRMPVARKLEVPFR